MLHKSEIDLVERLIRDIQAFGDQNGHGDVVSVGLRDHLEESSVGFHGDVDGVHAEHGLGAEVRGQPGVMMLN